MGAAGRIAPLPAKLGAKSNPDIAVDTNRYEKLLGLQMQPQFRTTSLHSATSGKEITMPRRSILTLSVIAAVATGAAAYAQSDHGHSVKSNAPDGRMMMQNAGSSMRDDKPDMMKMMKKMHRMHGGMMGGKDHGMMGGAMMQMLDADGDGNITPQEMREQMQAKLTEYDSDGDGSLSISEFEALHSAMIRETMVDRFQYLDADGDGSVTAEEMTAPADKMERMRKMRDGMKPMQPSDGAGMGDNDIKNDD